MSPQGTCCGPDYRTGKFYVKKINNCGLAHPPHHDVMSSAKAVRGNVEIFGILFTIILRSNPPVFSFILSFPTSPKSQFY